ncbi:hypothetical protein PROFUN_12044 [Planoprotostelium fungivorum]|uniref:Uncharacterized protein n=1 Tax=Planoprotostelium fungivorum TaxID=1890364 RepID=A0A2P6MXI1_9EUKA|nr:hypothetical protein PROFUN_12044 [Planoprotostelium fungivorum]
MLFDDSISDGDFSLKDMENHTQTSYKDILMDSIVDLDGNQLDLDVLGKDLDDGEFVEMSSIDSAQERKVKLEDSDFEGEEAVEEVTKSTSINSRRRSTAPITFVEEEEEEEEEIEDPF